MLFFITTWKDNYALNFYSKQLSLSYFRPSLTPADESHPFRPVVRHIFSLSLHTFVATARGGSKVNQKLSIFGSTVEIILDSFFRGEGFIPFDLPETLQKSTHGEESFQNPLVLLDQTSKSREAQINVAHSPSSFLIQKKKKKLISLPPVWDMSPLIIRVVPGELGTGVYYGPWQRYYLVAASQARDDLESLSFFGGGYSRDRPDDFLRFLHIASKKKKSKCFGMLSQRDKCSPNCSWGERERRKLCKIKGIQVQGIFKV